jgi:hypothetical protein
MEDEDSWGNDPHEICEVCNDQLCGGECEKQMPHQLIGAGLAGISLILLALLLKLLVLS